MSRRRKDPLRTLTDERQELTHLSRSRAAPAVRVARAVIPLAVAAGSDYQQAARAAARDRILREAARTPTPENDGTSTWSLTILRRVAGGMATPAPTGGNRSGSRPWSPTRATAAPGPGGAPANCCTRRGV